MKGGGEMVKRLRMLPVHLLLWVILSMMLFPAVVMVSTSLKTFEEIFSWPPTWIPDNVQWENYIRVWFGEYQFSRPFFNSVFISSVTSLLTVLFAFPAAYALSRFSFQGREYLLIYHVNDSDVLAGCVNRWIVSIGSEL